MRNIFAGIAAGVLLAVGAPKAWRFLAARNNTQVHQVSPR